MGSMLPGLIMTEIMAALLVIAFTTWAGVVWKGLKGLRDKLDELLQDIHADRIELERRISTLEVLVDGVNELLKVIRKQRERDEKNVAE